MSRPYTFTWHKVLLWSVKLQKIIVALVLLFLSACSNLVQVKIDVVDQRTALENQVLGSYNEIQNDTILLASVRSIDETGQIKASPVMSENKKKAIKALQRSAFNKDDIDEYKDKLVLGEGNDGYIHLIKTGSAQEPDRFLQELIKEENEDRGIIVRRIVAVEENLDGKDIGKVEKIMARLNRDNESLKRYIQKDNGDWIIKPPVR